MRNYVIINEVNSLTIQGLAINILPPITKPLIRSQIEEIDGRDGDIITELGYSAYDKSMEIGLWGEYDIDAIIKYFTGEGTVIFSTEPDKFYYYKILNQIDYDKLLKFKKATVTLHCQPFKYPVEETPIEGEAITVTGSGSNITLQNTVVAPIEMKLYGNTSQTGTPTPDSPQDIHTVSGDNSINVVGKNLAYTGWAENFVTRINNTNHAKIETYDNKNCLNFICYAGYGDYDNKYMFKINWEENAQYTIRFDIKPTSTFTNMAILYTDNSITNFGINLVADTWTHISITSTANKTIKYIRANYQNGYCYLDLNTFQVEKGETATTYEPYQSNSYDIDLGVENLLQFTPVIHNANGITIIYDDDILTINGTATSNVLPALNTITGNGQTHYLQTEILSGSTTSTTSYVQVYYPGLVVLSKSLNESGIVTNTLANGTYSTRLNIPNGAVFNNLKLRIHLQEGSTPKYISTTPIELCKIGTYQDRIFKSSGKNLFNGEIQNIAFGSQGSTNVVLVNTAYRGLYIPCEEGKTYSVSRLNTSNGRFRVMFTSTIPVAQTELFGGTGNTDTYDSALKIENITAPQNAKYLVMYLSNSSQDIPPIMINEGQTSLPYEPYGTDWYVEKKIGKVVLNGSESFVRYSALDTTNYNCFYISSTLAKLDSAGNNYWVLSNYFKGDKFDNRSVDTANIWLGKFSKQIAFKVPNTITTTGELQTWLGTHNTTIEYVLDIPTYTKIEGTLKEQLEALKPYSYNPTTNITQDNNDAPFELDVSLSYTNTMNVNNIGNIYAKPILTLEGSGNIGIILNDIEILSVDLGEGGKIAIDVPNLQAYNPDDDTLLNRLVTGDYMKLLIQEGDNTIAFSGSVTHATLEKYTRWI